MEFWPSLLRVSPFPSRGERKTGGMSGRRGGSSNQQNETLTQLVLRTFIASDPPVVVRTLAGDLITEVNNWPVSKMSKSEDDVDSRAFRHLFLRGGAICQPLFALPSTGRGLAFFALFFVRNVSVFFE